MLKAKDRLIVALDVPTAKDALALVDDLKGVVSFYKVGWQLFMAGEWKNLLEALKEERVFVDLKVPGDIGATIKSVVETCVVLDVTFLTLSDSVSIQAIEAAKQGKGGEENPKLLMVPFLSSLDETDLKAMYGGDATMDKFIATRAESALRAGCDGLIASGSAISMLRGRHRDAIIVSPGIRPAGSSTDDHKRHTTPAEAIRLGADYLVVGRPIRMQDGRNRKRDAAQRIIDEIESASGGSERGSRGAADPIATLGPDSVAAAAE